MSRARVIGGRFQGLMGTIQHIRQDRIFIALDNKRGVFLIHVLPKKDVKIIPNGTFALHTSVCDRFGNFMIVSGVCDDVKYTQLKYPDMKGEYVRKDLVQDFVRHIPADEKYPPNMTEETIQEVEGLLCDRRRGQKRKRAEEKEQEPKRRKTDRQIVTQLMKRILVEDEQVHKLIVRTVNLELAKILLEQVN